MNLNFLYSEWEKMSIVKRLAETDYVRSAIKDKADLSAFKEKPSILIILSVAAIWLSYIIGWPAISVLSTISIYLRKLLRLVIGGPAMSLCIQLTADLR
jgi:uncharacterized membrane protein